jgi:hypothetical protein
MTAVAALVISAACSSRDIPAGPIGEAMDLRALLPTGLRDAARSTPDTTYSQRLSVGPDSAAVELVWTAFGVGTGRYLATLTARLIAPASYDSVRLGDVAVENAGSKFDPVEAATIDLRWFKRSIGLRRSGATRFRFEAIGRRIVGPQER